MPVIAVFQKRRKKAQSWMRRLRPRKRLGIFFFHIAPELPGVEKQKVAQQAPLRQGPSPEALPSDMLVSVSFDGCGTWFCAMAALFAAHLVEDHACVTKQAFRLLGLLEQLATALPMVTNFGIFFAAVLDGEHATVKKRHGNGLCQRRPGFNWRRLLLLARWER